MGKTLKRRPGWDCERGAAVHGYSNATSFTKGVAPAREKIGLELLLDPEATLADLAEAISQLPQVEIDEAKARLAECDRQRRIHEPLTPEEWDRRYREQTGRADSPPVRARATI